MSVDNSSAAVVDNTLFRNIQINEFILDGAGSEMAVFFIATIIMIFHWLNQVDGKFLRIHLFLMHRKFHLIQSSLALRIANKILLILIYFLMMFPLLILAVYGAALINQKKNDNQLPISGSGLLLLGGAFICFSFAYGKIFWNKYRFTWEISCFFVLAFACYIAYQLVVVLYDDSYGSFFGYSCIFFNCNGILVLVLLFLHTGKTKASIKDFIKQRLLPGQPLDKERTDSFLDEIIKQRADDNFIPTFNDVADIFSIIAFKEKKVVTAFGGGMQHSFTAIRSIWKKRIISFLIYGASVGCLVIYSFIIYWFEHESKQGFTLMIAILVSDVILYFVFLCKIMESSLYLTMSTILNRFLLLLFGGDHWIYGYMLIYLYYCSILLVVIGRRRFPFEDAYGEINLDRIVIKSKNLDISRVPEFLLILINVIFAAVFGMLVLTTPQGVSLPQIMIGITTYNFYIVALFCFLLQIAFASILMSYRLFIRKKREIKSQTNFFFKIKKFDLYWMFIFFSFLSVAVFSLISYWATENISYFVVGIFGAIYVILFLNSVLHYTMNDYRYFQSIAELNDKIKAHNKKIALINAKTKQIRSDIRSGKTSAAIGGAAMGLAKTIADKNKQEKVAKKQEVQKRKDIELAKSANKSISSAYSMFRNGNNQASVVLPFQENSQTMNNSSLQGAQQPPSPVPKVENFFPPINPPKSQKAIINQEDEDLIRQEMRDKGEDFEGGEEEKAPGPKNDTVDQPNLNQSMDVQLVENVSSMHGGEDGDSDDDDDNEPVDPETILDNEEEASLLINRPMLALRDWRADDNMTPFQAYFKGKLRRNDYQIINSLIFSFISLVLMALIVCLVEKSLFGITIAVPFLHYGMAIFSYIRVLNTLGQMSIFEMIMFFLAYGFQYGWGVAYLFIGYPELERGQDAKNGTFLIIYLIVIPFITSLVSAVMKWVDEPRPTPMFLVQFSLTVAQGIAMLVCAFIYIGITEGIVILSIVVVVVYMSLMGWIYKKNDYFMPKIWQRINIVVASLLIIAPVIVGVSTPQFLTFIGFSLSVWVFSFFLLLYATVSIAQDLQRNSVRPIFFSPMIFPVYRYNPKTNDIDLRNLPSICYIVGLMTMMAWSALCTVWVQPYYIGITFGILFQLMLVVFMLCIVTVTSVELKENSTYLDSMIIKQAWLDSKQSYVKSRGAESRKDLLTYEKARIRRDHYRNYIRIYEGRTHLNPDEILSNVRLETKEEVDISWLNLTDEELMDKVALYSKLFEVEEQLGLIYLQELELIIQFLLMMLQQAESLQASERKLLFTFISEKKPAMFAMGIVINIPEEGSMQIRYARVITQIQRLSPEKQTFFNSMRDKFMDEKRELEEQRRDLAVEQELKDQERQEEQSKMSDEKRELLAMLAKNPNMSVDDMPDCLEKWQKILLEGKKFTDMKFDHLKDEVILGKNARNFQVAEWFRVSEKDVKGDYSLYIGDASALDVQQGVIGDCYFMSAISVVGSKHIQDNIIVTKEAEWRTVGAFCVKFYRGGQEEYVIVDDYFPLAGNGDTIFAQGGEKGFELWPAVLEKAYAKMYGSYSIIECGKVQNALADLTNGFPDCFNLADYGKNDKLLWEKIKVMYKHGDLMGAGSHGAPEGDRNINEQGIVSGHAYAILNVVEDSGYRLMQLRNPHGVRATTAEWNGDWCDDSSKWNPRLRNLLNNPKKVWKEGEEVKNDGVFWMDVGDFVQQYANLYICRTCDGWKKYIIDDEWIGPSAQGLPNSKNKNPNPILNQIPQYQITVNKPCDGFIALQQFNSIDTYRGKLDTFAVCLKLGGKMLARKEDMAKKNILAKSEITNLLINAFECDFDQSVSYPYKFTLFITNSRSGPGEDGGEGKYMVKIYSTDDKMTVTRINPVKDECDIREDK